MLSQREMFEHQISQEAEELKRYPKEEAEELAALIYEARGVPIAEARDVAAHLVANPDKALDTLAREELGLNPDDLGGDRRGPLVLRLLRRRREPAAHSLSSRRA